MYGFCSQAAPRPAGPKQHSRINLFYNKEYMSVISAFWKLKQDCKFETTLAYILRPFPKKGWQLKCKLVFLSKKRKAATIYIYLMKHKFTWWKQMNLCHFLVKENLWNSTLFQGFLSICTEIQSILHLEKVLTREHFIISLKVKQSQESRNTGILLQ